MVNVIKFNQHAPSELTEIGISHDAVSRILLGRPGANPPALMSCPNVARVFTIREYNACNITYDALVNDPMKVGDPVTGEDATCVQTFLPADWKRASAPLFKSFQGGGREFGLAFLGIISRVTHIIIPDKNCVICDLDSKSAEYAWDEFMRAPVPTLQVNVRPKRVGIVDMVLNYAHQAMNHLSGIQRLIECDAADGLDEIWVSGTEFFGATQRVFPDLAAKIRHVRQADLSAAMEGCEAFKIGSNVMSAGLRNRLLRLANAAHPRQLPAAVDHYPIVAFSVRVQGRRCLNLAEVIQQIVDHLLIKHPRLGVILDGWSFPETALAAGSNIITSMSDRHLNNMRQEAKQVEMICANIPSETVIQILTGMPLLQAISALQSVDAYVAHVGTPQHKIGWFTNARGVVHGPTAQLSPWLDTGTYCSEVGFPPDGLSVSCVTDTEVETSRGPTFYDYTINDVGGIIDALERFIAGR